MRTQPIKRYIILILLLVIIALMLLIFYRRCHIVDYFEIESKNINDLKATLKCNNANQPITNTQNNWDENQDEENILDIKKELKVSIKTNKEGYKFRENATGTIIVENKANAPYSITATWRWNRDKDFFTQEFTCTQECFNKTYIMNQIIHKSGDWAFATEGYYWSNGKKYRLSKKEYGFLVE